MTGPVVFFEMGEPSHFARVHPVIAAVAARGVDTYVFTDRRFEPQVTSVGARFVDLFAGRPVDDDSLPTAARYVTWAGDHADAIIAEAQRLRPGVIVYDTFAVIGRVVALALGLPFANVCSGHNIDPARFLPELWANPRFKVSDRCHAAARLLKERHGLAEASPFVGMAALSPHLNVYGEPPQFLTADERRVFEPVAFFGSLPDVDLIPISDGLRSAGDHTTIYVAFGTVIWGAFLPVAIDALRAIVHAIAARPDATAVISLGGATFDHEVIGELSARNIEVVPYVDQWRALDEAAVFVTHHGMKSTHEAIFRTVPMVSYPFFWDQPALAATCQALGLAVSLSTVERGPITEADVHGALDAAFEQRASMHERLREARHWELDVISTRPAVAQRIIDLGAMA